MSFSFLPHYAEAAGLPEQTFWVQKIWLHEYDKYYRSVKWTERTMMMALLSQVPNPSALEVDKLEDDYWEAYDATFNYKVYRQEEEPPAPANCLLWVSQAPELSFSSTEPIKKLPKLVI